MRELASRTVVVTGAGGFIGSSLVEVLVERGAVVRVLIAPRPAETATFPAAVFARYGDICDVAVLDELMEDAELVVHLAAPPSVAASFEDPVECSRVCVQGTAAVLAAAQRAGARRVVHVSSAEVYGPDAPRPVNENHRTNPVSPYGRSKLEAEVLVDAGVSSSALEGVVLRPFSVFGRGMSPSSVLISILRQVEAGRQVSLADMRPVRDYCYVADVVEAIVLACVSPLTRRLSLYNIGSGVGTSVAELATLVCTTLGVELPLRSEPSRRRPVDILTLVADSSRASAELGWRSRTSLPEGLGLLLGSR